MSPSGRPGGEPRFAREVFEASRAIDEAFAQGFALTPMMAAAERAAPDVADSSRTAIELRGIYVDPEAKPIEPNSYDVRQARRPGVESGHPRIEISPYEMARLSGCLGKPFLAGPPDQLTRLSDSAVFRVTRLYVTPNGTAYLYVNKAG